MRLEKEDWRYHQHKCTFEMLYPEEAIKKCRMWRAQHPIKFPYKWPRPKYREDYCDFCEMMNYVALDSEGRIISVTHTNPSSLIAYFNSKNKT